MRKLLAVLLASFALLLPATLTPVKADTYVVNGYLIWLGSGPPDQPPPPGWSNWVWFGWCWGAYWVGS